MSKLWGAVHLAGGSDCYFPHTQFPNKREFYNPCIRKLFCYYLLQGGIAVGCNIHLPENIIRIINDVWERYLSDVSRVSRRAHALKYDYIIPKMQGVPSNDLPNFQDILQQYMSIDSDPPELTRIVRTGSIRGLLYGDKKKYRLSWAEIRAQCPALSMLWKNVSGSRSSTSAVKNCKWVKQSTICILMIFLSIFYNI